MNIGVEIDMLKFGQIKDWDIYNYFRKHFKIVKNPYFDTEDFEMKLYIDEFYVGDIECVDNKWGNLLIAPGNLQKAAQNNEDTREKIINMFEYFKCVKCD